MKEFIAKYQKAIVGTGAVAVLVLCYFQQKELAQLRIEASVAKESVAPLAGDIKITQTIDSLENVIDSIRAENIPLQTQLGRYEMALELLREEDKKAAERYEKIITSQTE
jgi:hypothetical protein